MSLLRAGFFISKIKVAKLMDRVETYVGQSVTEWLFSKQAQNDMTGLAKLTAAVLGTTTVGNGLACTATGPASMFVNIGAGELYQSANLENTICGTLPADTAHQLQKQGILLDTLQVPNANTGVTALTAPGSSGQSINYLIEATYADSDVSLDPTTGTSPVVLPFYNSSNPQTPYSGPGNTGQSSNTFRKGVITFTVKAGAAATTGTQTTPSVDSGYVGLWVVTVPFGAVTLTATNIAAYPGQPILPSSVLQSIISGNLQYGIDSGAANTVQAVYPLPPTSLKDNQPFWVKIANTNTAATTFTPNPGVIAPSPVVGAAHAALQGNELVANGRALFVWRNDITSYVLLECTGGALQIAPATQSQHAMQLGQATGRLLRVSTYYMAGGTQLLSVNGAAGTTTGATTFTSLAAANSIDAEGCGGGGGGGGSSATSASQVSVGAGGASGSYARARYTSGFSGGLTVTCGAAGSSSASNPGTAGGSTSLGALLTMPGGGGGQTILTATTTAVAYAGQGGPGALPTGSGAIVGSQGVPGPIGFTFGSACASGQGASCSYGSGGPNTGATAAGANGTGFGSGGSGASALPSGAANAGGAGGGGLLIIREYS